MGKRILIATGTYWPEASGQSTFVSRLVEFLKKSEVEISVLAYGEKQEYSEYLERNKLKSDLDIDFIPKNIFRYFLYFLKLRSKAKSADIIFAQDLVSSGLPAALAKRKNQKLIVRIGGDFLWEKMVNAGSCRTPLSRYYGRPKSILEKIYLLVYRLVIARSDKLVFNTAWQAKIYQDHFKLPAEKVEVIDNPYKKIEIDHSENYRSNEIIFAGRFIPLKNLQKLIEAFKKIKTDMKLVLIGDGPEKSNLEKSAAADPRVVFEPKLAPTDLLARLGKAYLVVLPSISEVNPNLALEALSLGVPCMLTSEVGIKDELKDLFYLVDPFSAESLVKAFEYLMDLENYCQFKIKIKDARLEFGWPQVAENYLKVFSSL